MTLSELNRWSVGGRHKVKSAHHIFQKGEWYYLDGKEKDVSLRKRRHRESERKMRLAQKAARWLEKIPSVYFVGVSGSLAMNNASAASDIDFLVITKEGMLWTTRLISLLWLLVGGYPIRRAGVNDESDKVCLNVWMDRSELKWYKDRQNWYSAHEILQVIPLVDKHRSYEAYLSKNSWAWRFWPRVHPFPKRVRLKLSRTPLILQMGEWLLMKVQILYMKSKVTCETITPKRALFHPFDWSEKVNSAFSSYVV